MKNQLIHYSIKIFMIDFMFLMIQLLKNNYHVIKNYPNQLETTADKSVTTLYFRNIIDIDEQILRFVYLIFYSIERLSFVFFF
jgi:hypothetical protein